MIKQVVLAILKENGFDGYEAIKIDETSSAVFVFHKDRIKQEFYVVNEMTQNHFLEFDEDKLFSQISEIIKKSYFYVPEVDKNTSLIICVEKAIENRDEELLERKELKIEENPYFYKKYVISYNAKLAKELFADYLTSYNNYSNVTRFINDQINDSRRFIDFKLNAINNEEYALLSKLVMKIPIMPVEIPNSDSIKHISEIINKSIKSDNLEKAETLAKLFKDDKTKENNLEENVKAIIECWERSDLNE